MQLLTRNFMHVLLLAVVLAAVSACGQKGPLYLPDNPDVEIDDSDDSSDPIY